MSGLDEQEKHKKLQIKKISNYKKYVLVGVLLFMIFGVGYQTGYTIKTNEVVADYRYNISLTIHAFYDCWINDTTDKMYLRFANESQIIENLLTPMVNKVPLNRREYYGRTNTSFSMESLKSFTYKWLRINSKTEVYETWNIFDPTWSNSECDDNGNFYFWIGGNPAHQYWYKDDYGGKARGSCIMFILI
jgi:hypothetical protein